MLLSTRRRRAGFGGLGYDYSQLESQLENCGAASTVADQYACEQRNQAKQVAFFNSPDVVAYNAKVAATEAANVAAAGGTPAQVQQQVQAFIAANPQVTPAAVAAASAPQPPATPTPSTRIAPGVLSIFNTTRGGSSNFQVGDAWTIQISGASPNQPVTAVSVQNQTSHGEESFGQTDGAGNFSISGVMAADQKGNWAETWKVAGVVSGVLAFSVVQGPGASGTQSTTPTSFTNTPVPNNAQGSNSTPDASSAADTTAGYLTYSPDAYASPDTTAGSSTTPTALTNFWSFLQQTAQIGSWSFPYWLLGVGGLGAVWAFRGHERGRR